MIDSDSDFLSSLLANGVALNVNQQGFRAVAQGSDVYIIAPQSASQNFEYTGGYISTEKSMSVLSRSNYFAQWWNE
jgi:hypothetical protein